MIKMWRREALSPRPPSPILGKGEQNCMIDGNNRTGIPAAGLFLLRNGFRLVASNTDLEYQAEAVAQSQVAMDDLADWIRCHAQPL